MNRPNPNHADAEPKGTDNPVVWRCAVPSPLRQLLDYLPAPDSVAAPGARVKVPLGKRQLIAVVIEVTRDAAVDAARLRRAEAVLDTSPLLDASLLALIRWVAHYYVHPLGEVAPLSLAPRERRGEPPAATGEPGLTLTLRGRGLPAQALRKAPKQALLLSLLQQGPQTLTALKAAGISGTIVRELLSKALAERCELTPPGHWSARAPLEANAEQQAAIDAISDQLGSFSCHVLQGVTGSGKTEVYLQLIAETVRRGQQALVLLPEIALTPQMLERFRARFTALVVELHSGLADGARDRNWAAARKGEAAVVIGTRSAVFVPLAQPGLIIIDEEHEATFTQQDGLRYSARDVAVKRAQLCGCPIVLGSATPSLETLDNIERGRFHRHRLSQRAGGATLPEREVLDIRGLALEAGLSEPLMAAVQQTLAAGNQALLFLNRRGFAPALSCHDCGWVADCQHCDARMTIHRQPPRLQCHHCGSQSPLPRQCPQCLSGRLLAAGVGTEQTEQTIRQRFTEQAVYRVDSDVVRTRSAMATLRDELAREEPAVLVGTQMLAKGHDFPAVTLVGVVDADGLLFSPDFRGEERLLQLLTQVAGRAGRGDRPGRVLIQTRHPDHPLIEGLLEQTYEQQATALLAERRQRGLPPAGALAVLRADSSQREHGLEFLKRVAEGAAEQLAPCRLVGPLATPMARRAGMSRCQLVISGPSRSAVGAAVRTLVNVAASIKTPPRTRWFADVDPVDPI